MLDTIASENIHVQFELALYDENGNKLGTPGVEYVKYPSSLDSIDCNEFMKGKQYARYMWDPNNYINVMVYNFKQGESTDITLGISNLPYQGAGYPQIEGLTKSEHAVLHKNNLSYPYCVSLNAIFIDKRYEGTRYTTDKNKKQYTYVPLARTRTSARIHQATTEMPISNGSSTFRSKPRRKKKTPPLRLSNSPRERTIKERSGRQIT